MSIITLEREKSKKIYEDSLEVIPGGVNSPVRAFFGLEMTPLVVTAGKGDRLIDADGRSYIDYCMSWGALILGHGPEKVVRAAAGQMAQGSSFGTMTPYEETLARQIIKHFPSIEKLRFVSSATEAVMSAIRLARGYTGRKKIVKFNGNYHGHSDGLLVRAGSGVNFVNAQASSKGILEEQIAYTFSLPYNNIEACKELFRQHEDIAAVILEPVCGNMGVVPASPEFIHMLRDETNKRGIILIIDEVITGFRVGLKGAQGLYGVSADLTCLGKIMGGGMPAAAFGGYHKIMNELAPLGQVYQAGTLSGNPVAMVAAIETLKEVETKGFYEILEEKTRILLDPIAKAFKEKNINACVQRVGSMFTLFFGLKKVTCREDLEKLDQETFKELFKFLFEEGVYFPPSPFEAGFISTAHTQEDLEMTRDLTLDFINQKY